MELRAQSISFLEANREEFEPFLEEDFEGYCDYMA
jgi:hypothetical protein